MRMLQTSGDLLQTKQASELKKVSNELLCGFRETNLVAEIPRGT